MAAAPAGIIEPWVQAGPTYASVWVENVVVGAYLSMGYCICGGIAR